MKKLLILAVILIAYFALSSADEKISPAKRVYLNAPDKTLDSAKAWADTFEQKVQAIGDSLNQITLKKHEGHNYYRLPDQSIDRCYPGANCAIYYFCETCSTIFHLFEYKPLAREEIKKGNKTWKVEKYQLEQLR